MAGAPRSSPPSVGDHPPRLDVEVRGQIVVAVELAAQQQLEARRRRRRRCSPRDSMSLTVRSTTAAQRASRCIGLVRGVEVEPKLARP
jgi:hypothetical protein